MSGAHAQVPREHSIPSCFDQLREYAPRAGYSDLTVIIDQTTFMDARLRQIVRETVDRLIKPGTNVTVAVFSAYLQGRYLDVLASGQIELPIEPKQRDFVPKRELRQSDQCLNDQLVFGRRLVAKTLDAAFAAGDPDIVRSDVLSALRDLSRRVGDSPVSTKIVIVVSDMLENSTITSFYQASRLRRIKPEVELQKAAESGIKADFLGARVFVIGAGAVSEKSADANSYRDPRAMLALEDFWRRWFALNHAELVEFGRPTPLVEINWPTRGVPASDGR